MEVDGESLRPRIDYRKACRGAGHVAYGYDDRLLAGGNGGDAQIDLQQAGETRRKPGVEDLRILPPDRDSGWQRRVRKRADVDAYEQLHLGKNKELLLESVDDLPKTLIRTRIAAGMTQEGLAFRLGLKTQQIQRYEATEYESASFARVLKVVSALGLTMPKPARLVRRG